MILTALSIALAAAPTTSRAQRDAETLRSIITAGARSCAAGKPDEIVAHYSKDILLSYPGVPDQRYDDLLSGYRRMCKGAGEGSLESSIPNFEEILVSGDMAVARITWSTHIRGMAPGTVRQLRDVQIWQKKPGGWKFIRGVHYPIKPKA